MPCAIESIAEAVKRKEKKKMTRAPLLKSTNKHNLLIKSLRE